MPRLPVHQMQAHKQAQQSGRLPRHNLHARHQATLGSLSPNDSSESQDASEGEQHDSDEVNEDINEEYGENSDEINEASIDEDREYSDEMNLNSNDEDEHDTDEDVNQEDRYEPCNCGDENEADESYNAEDDEERSENDEGMMMETEAPVAVEQVTRVYEERSVFRCVKEHKS